MIEPMLSGGSGPDAPVEATLVHRLNDGPREGGVCVIVNSLRARIVRARELAKRLHEVTTVLAVIPPRATDPTTDDAGEFVDQLAQLLSGAPVHMVVGDSIGAYVAARLAGSRAAHQARHPHLVLLEPPPPEALLSKPLSALLYLPGPAMQRFTDALDGVPLATAPRGTPQFRRQIVRTFLAHRVELETALHGIDPATLLAPPEFAFDIYPEWASWVSLCMQLASATYRGPTVSVQGQYTAELDTPDRERRAAWIREAFPQARVHETTMRHRDLLSEAVLRPYLSQAVIQ